LSVTAIFITATGTDVGKTYVAAALIRHLRQMGRTVDAIKPIVSGFDPAKPNTSDPGILLTALGRQITQQEIGRISPWQFRAPLSPDLAAKREDRTIDVDAVIKFCHDSIEAAQDILLIEGVGGIMVPLDEHKTVLDVMMALRLPLILVAGSYLGTISHTLTALDSLYRREMNVIATIVSETPNSTVPLDESVAAIARFTEPVIGLPRARRPDSEGSGLDRIFDPRGGRPPAGRDSGAPARPPQRSNPERNAR
jgi:dethiobiotin synthetase